MFELRGLELPKKHYSSAPNFPYFNLYDVPGSPCDSLGIDGTTALQSLDEEVSIQVFPNPTSDVINIDWNSIYPGKWYLTDILGRNLKDGIVKDRLTTQIDMHNFPSGLYYVLLYMNDDLVETHKVVLIK